MENKLSVLWLLTARSGSKSIPHKNIKLLNGKPLLAYRILSVKESNYCNDIWISTDSEEYALIAKEFGANVPFIRPVELSTDESSSIDVVLHAMNFALRQNLKFDFIGLLEPTSPFINSKSLNKAIETLQNNSEAESIVAVRESRPNTKFIQDESMFLDSIAANIKECSSLIRQQFKKQITPSGGFYISKWESFLTNKSFYTKSTLGFIVSDIEGLEIDEPIDWEFAEFLISKKN